MRDDTILEAIRARIRAAAPFSDPTRAAVLRGVPDEVAGPGELAIRAVAWVAWIGATEAMDDTGPTGPNYLRTCEFQVHLEARAEEPEARLHLLARLDSAVRNAVLGPGAADPPWLSIAFGRAAIVRDVPSPAARAILPGEAIYTVTGPDGRDASAGGP